MPKDKSNAEPLIQLCKKLFKTINADQGMNEQVADIVSERVIKTINQDLEAGKMRGIHVLAEQMLRRLLTDYSKITDKVQSVLDDMMNFEPCEKCGRSDKDLSRSEFRYISNSLENALRGTENFLLEATRLSIEERYINASWGDYTLQECVDDGVDHDDWALIPITTKLSAKDIGHKKRIELSDHLRENHFADLRCHAMSRYLYRGVPYSEVEKAWEGFSEPVPETLLDCLYFKDCFPDEWKRLTDKNKVAETPCDEITLDEDLSESDYEDLEYKPRNTNQSPVNKDSGKATNESDVKCHGAFAKKSGKQNGKKKASKSAQKPDSKKQTTRLGAGRFKGKVRAKLVEDSLTLNFATIKKLNLLNKKEHFGKFVWLNELTGKDFEVHYHWLNHLESDGGPPELTLEYKVTIADGLDLSDFLSGGSLEDVVVSRKQTIRLARRDIPRGGMRWYFECPTDENAAEKLHLPALGEIFASKKGHGLKHLSQYKNRRANPV